MAKSSKKKPAKRKSRARQAPRGRPLRRWGIRAVLLALVLAIAPVPFYSVVNPPITLYQWQEAGRLGGVERDWVAMDHIAPVMARAAVAAEDANFCLHWGFDMAAIRGALEAGGRYGASTISQQTVKNVYLWHGRTWTRKALEALITPMVELTWSKRRILEVYLNVAEFGEGIFGIEAAARHYYGVTAAKLSPDQAAALAAVLPNPKGRTPTNLSPTLRRRAAQIRDGAATIRADGRDNCFES